jgi:MFS family permease
MTRIRFYYGWRIVVVAALAMVGTLPGRSQGLGLITEPLLADMGLDRVTYAGLNFWATIAGAIGALGIGRLVDQFGARVVLTGVVLTLSAVVCVMSQTTTIAGLTIALTLTRGVGQSALSVVSITMVGHWFVRRIDAAMAAYSLTLSAGFMVAFPVVGWLIQAWSWRLAWLSIGLMLAVALAPLSWVVVRDGPEALALGPDDEETTPASGYRAERDLAGHRWSEALGSGAFWIFAVGTALYGLVASGIGLFNESILAERGFAPNVYYQTLVVTALTALAGNFLGGWLLARASLLRLMSGSLAALAAGLVVLPHVASVATVMAWAALMGVSGGLVMVMFFSVWSRVFGRRHLGRIQGTAQALTVLASALGPVLLAWCVALTGSYAAMFRILGGVVAVTALTALVVDLPQPAVPHDHQPQRSS